MAQVARAAERAPRRALYRGGRVPPPAFASLYMADGAMVDRAEDRRRAAVQRETSAFANRAQSRCALAISPAESRFRDSITIIGARPNANIPTCDICASRIGGDGGCADAKPTRARIVRAALEEGFDVLEIQNRPSWSSEIRRRAAAGQTRAPPSERSADDGRFAQPRRPRAAAAASRRGLLRAAGSSLSDFCRG